MANQKDKQAPTVIKKYANRRLYNTATSRYVTLDDLCDMVKSDEDFVVNDAKTGMDITRSVLTQIIVEQEAKGTNLLPVSFLKQLISLYDGNMQWLVPAYLERSMEAFHANQAQMQEYMAKALGGMFNLQSLEEMSKQNIAMFDQTMRMFSPFAIERDGETQMGETSSAPQTAPPLDELLREIDRLRAELAALKAQDKDT